MVKVCQYSNEQSTSNRKIWRITGTSYIAKLRKNVIKNYYKIKSEEDNVNINEILIRIIDLIYEGMRRTIEHNYRDLNYLGKIYNYIFKDKILEKLPNYYTEFSAKNRKNTEIVTHINYDYIFPIIYEEKHFNNLIHVCFNNNYSYRGFYMMHRGVISEERNKLKKN